MTENEKNQRRLEYLINEAFDDIDIEEKTEEQKIEFSAEHVKKIENLLQKEKNRRIIKKSRKILMKIAVVFLVCIIGMTFGVEANRVKFLNFIMKYTDKYTEIRYNENSNDISNLENTNKNEEQKNGIELKYIPQNFALKRKQITQTNIYMAFENGEKNFVISAKEQEGTVHIDTENADVESMKISNKQCMLVEKNGRVSAHWTTGNMVYLVSGNIEKQEIVNIIKNIEE